MTGAIDALGALSDTGIRTQYVTAHVVDVDREKLKAAVGAAKGGLASAGIDVADALPKVALDAALPYGKKVLKDRYGVDVEYTVSNAPTGPRPKSEFWPGAAVGAGAAAILLAVGYGISRLVGRKG